MGKLELARLMLLVYCFLLPLWYSLLQQLKLSQIVMNL